MSSNNSGSAANSSIGISGLLGVAFVVLKLCDVIQWNWIYVLLPFWWPLGIVAVIMVVAFPTILILHGLDRLQKRRLRKRRENAVIYVNHTRG